MSANIRSLPNLRFALIIASGVLLAASAFAQQQHPRFERGFNENRLYDLGDLDQVNLFNGNLSIAIPIGQAYPLGGDRTFQLKLTYNSKVWDQEIDENTGDPYLTYTTVAQLNPFENAGIGWSLNLGRLQPPTSPGNETADWIYVSPDGAEHSFKADLRANQSSGSGFGFTRDSSYLRIKHGSAPEVHFPDGQVHRFDGSGRLTSMRDPHGNSILNVAYPGSRWEISDRFGRSYVVNYNTFAGRPYITSVQLPTFNGGSTTFDLTYAPDTTFEKPLCIHSDPVQPTQANVRRLESISLPNDTSYDFTYNDGGVGNCSNGTLASMRIPTGATSSYNYGEYRFAKPCSGNEGHTGGPPSTQDIPRLFSTSLGVSTKTLTRGNDIDTWTYEQDFIGEVGNQNGCLAGDNGNSSAWEYAKTIVTDPIGHQRHHYFSMWQGNNPSGNLTTRKDHALPFTRVAELNDYAGWFLSSRVYDCPTVFSCELVRSTYVAYEHDFDEFNEAGSDNSYNVGNYNRRELKRRTVFHDDSNKRIDVLRDYWDGLGHYREEETVGNFDEGTNQRIQTTNYNCSSITSVCGSEAAVPANNAKWLLNTSSYSQTTQPGVPSYTSKTLTCFDTQGELILSRRLNGSGATNKDLVTVLERWSGSDVRAGSVKAEKSYGGDDANLPTGTSSICSPTSIPSAQLEYEIAHTRSSGVLASSRYQGTPDCDSGQPCSFPKHVDNVIDADTGLVMTSRDPSGLATSYNYDESSRVVLVKPSTAHGGAWTSINYQNHNPSSPTSTAKAIVRHRPNGVSSGGTILAEEELSYSAMGRLRLRTIETPNGQAKSRVEYDALGQRTRETVWGFGSAGSKATRFMAYDPFGRARQIKTPDALTQSRTYTGNRKIVTSTRIQLQLPSAAPEIVNKREFYDVLGRLDLLEEHPAATTTKANYAYDDQDRIRVATVSGVDGAQTRTFSYDRRGFLLWEQHPETPGANINYGSFDSKGNPGTRSHGGVTLHYDYDDGGRLVSVSDFGLPHAPQQLKTWVYENDSGAVGAFGKVKEAWRTNHFELNSLPLVVRVRQETEFAGVGGAPSARTLTDFFEAAPGPSATTDDETKRSQFRQVWEYNDLGQAAQVSYPQCLEAPVSDSTLCSNEDVRLVDNTFVDGYLTGVDHRLQTQAGAPIGGTNPLASEIRYLPTGQTSRVIHANDRQWLQVADRDEMARPGSIKVADSSEIVGLVLESYVGADLDFSTGPIHHASNWLEYSDVAIPSGGTLESVGGVSVLLQTGFHAQVGSSFTARLADATQFTFNEAWNSGDYSYDGAGNISQIGESLYRYDGLQRLVEAKVSVDPEIQGSPTLDRGYDYDTFGNLEEITGSPGRLIPTDSDTNRLLVGGAAYDARGNVTNLPVASFVYDSFNMATQIDYGAAGIWTHLYTADDERYYSYHQTTQVQPNGDLVADEDKWYLRDLDNKVLREIRHTFGSAPLAWVATDTVYRGSTLLASVERESKSSGELDEVVHYHVDHLGTPRLLTDSAGDVVDYRAYFPYGEQANFVAGGSGDGGDRMRFTGHERDLGVGSSQADDLDYMHARYFSPVYGRFLGVDPSSGSFELGMTGSWNRYSYVYGNPVGNVDPDGKVPWGLIKKGAKVALKGGDVAATFAGLASDVKTVFDSEASGRERLLAGLSAASEVFSPVSGRELKAAGGALGVGGAAKRTARRPTKAQRESALERSRGKDGVERCVYCGTPLDRKAGSPNSAEIDHRKAYANGGETVDENLDAACRSCNRSKGAKKLGATTSKTEWVPPNKRPPK